jgi:nitroreductase
MSQDDSGAFIRALRATRSYTSDLLDDDDLHGILEAGRWTGSSLNSQPWTFVVVANRESKQKLSQAGKYATHLASAAVVVVLVGEPGRGEFDIGRAAQNMMLAADAVGIGSCPATLHNQEAVQLLLGVPVDRLARHAIAFGHPNPDVERVVRRNMKMVTGSARNPLTDMVRHETFEQ